METTTSQALSIEHLAKNFGKLKVLRDVTFSVGQGELVCVLGPSGCGKTTLLRAVAGLISYDGGRVLVDGTPLAAQELFCHGIGVIFQEPRLLPWRTAVENARLPFELRGESADAHEPDIRAALALVGLSEFAAAYPHELSGGMKSRVSLARALATNPRLLLMDEPLTGLDVRTREDLQDEIMRIWTAKQMSLLWVTHDPEEAVQLADRIVVLSPRPTTVRGIVTVSQPRPRERHSEHARELVRQVRDLFA